MNLITALSGLEPEQMTPKQDYLEDIDRMLIDLRHRSWPRRR